jgi:hypothetical protein
MSQAAAQAILDGDARRSVAYARRSSPCPLLAYARLHVAEILLREGRAIEGRERVESSLAYWRAVGAKRDIEEGEAMLQVGRWT